MRLSELHTVFVDLQRYQPYQFESEKQCCAHAITADRRLIITEEKKLYYRD